MSLYPHPALICLNIKFRNSGTNCCFRILKPRASCVPPKQSFPSLSVAKAPRKVALHPAPSILASGFKVPVHTARGVVWTINQTITWAISVCDCATNWLSSSTYLRLDEWLSLHLCLSFFLVPQKKTEKPMMSVSPQIMGEKQQTFSGPQRSSFISL